MEPSNTRLTPTELTAFAREMSPYIRSRLMPGTPLTIVDFVVTMAAVNSPENSSTWTEGVTDLDVVHPTVIAVEAAISKVRGGSTNV